MRLDVPPGRVAKTLPETATAESDTAREAAAAKTTSTAPTREPTVATISQNSTQGITVSARPARLHRRPSRRVRCAEKMPNRSSLGPLIISVLSCLCASSMAAFSLYGTQFTLRLGYTQTQVNLIITAGQLCMYLSSPVAGWLCDTLSPAFMYLLGGIMFGASYVTAAETYRYDSLDDKRISSSLYQLMAVAFVGIGLATTTFYLGAMTTCAREFANSKHRGIAMAAPITALGLSSTLFGQIGTRFFTERQPDGTSGVDVYRFFHFMALGLFVVGLIGAFTFGLTKPSTMTAAPADDAPAGQRPVSERSETTSVVQGRDQAGRGGSAQSRSYGTISEGPDAAGVMAKSVEDAEEAIIDGASLPISDGSPTAKKTSATTDFLRDPTTYCFAVSFLILTSSGDSYMNNLGNTVAALAGGSLASKPGTNAGAQISIVGMSSTAGRLLGGLAADTLGPLPANGADPSRFEPGAAESCSTRWRPRISRAVMLIGCCVAMSIGYAAIASGLMQSHAPRLSISSVLVGLGYGGTFSISPVVVSAVWGRESFGTKWGIMSMTPSLGVAIWNFCYAIIAQRAATSQSTLHSLQGGRPAPHVWLAEGTLCRGKACYQTTFLLMAASLWVSGGLWLWAWKGRGGWARRGIVV